MTIASTKNKTPKHSKSLVASGSRNELIQIQAINGEQLIDARELHQFIGSKQQFSNWITNRISDYKFKEGSDFYTNLFKSKVTTIKRVSAHFRHGKGISHDRAKRKRQTNTPVFYCL
jgi:phage anti-repressor protein